jgi:predicted HD phosphohydrolase
VPILALNQVHIPQLITLLLPLTTCQGSDDETVIAALFHDIGQFLPLDAAQDVQMGMGDHSVGRVGHEMIGEEYLKSLGFGERVSKLVGSHVAAKR